MDGKDGDMGGRTHSMPWGQEEKVEKLKHDGWKLPKAKLREFRC